jgi:hypothetical protein
MASRDEQRRAASRIVARAWQDQSFKQQLMTDPVGILSAEGIQLPTGVEYRVVENTPNLQHLVIPARPVGPVVGTVVEDAVAAAFGSPSTTVIRGQPPRPHRPKAGRKTAAKKRKPSGTKKSGRRKK